MTARAGLPADSKVVPFFVDADRTPNPGGFPIGGVTIVDLPNNHLQYALTWFGLALTLIGVFAAYVWQARKGASAP
jgi:surfeit locus 1 family protein